MADFIATALVQIKADAKGFKKDVRQQINDALKTPFKAKIIPDTTGFTTAVRTQVNDAIKKAGKLKVPVLPEVKSFRKSFLDEARKNPIVIPAVADTKALRAQLVEKVATINAGLAVRIPVIAGDASDFVAEAERTGGAGGGGGKKKDDTKQESAAKKDLRKINDDLKLSQISLNESVKDGITQTEKDLAQKQALQRAGSALAASQARLLKNDTAANRALVEKSQAQVAAIGAVQDNTRVEGQLSAAIKKVNADLSKQVKVIETSAQAAQVEKAIKTQLVKVEEALALARKTGSTQAIRALETQKASLELQRTAAASATGGLLKAEAAASAASDAQKKLADQSAKTAANMRFAGRGAAATALSFLKIRGATLAANAQFLAGAAAIAVFAKAIQNAAALQQNLNVFAVTAGATAEQLARAGELARELGSDITLPAVSAGDAAEAMSGLAKAGLEVEDVFGGLRGTLQLATAAQIDNAEAVQLVASALNAFQLSGEEAVRVADLLTGAANESQGSVSDMGIALQQSAAAAHQAGISLEDTVAMLTLLGRSGLRGSDAGTSLRTALLRLIRPTNKAQAELDRLGVAIRDASGDVRPEVFADLTTRLNHLGKAERDAALALIFGQDAFRSAAILGREGAEGLDTMREATQKQGLAAELAGARTKGFSGQVEGLRNSLATLGGTLGTALLEPLGALIEVIDKLVNVLSSFGGKADSGFKPLDKADNIITRSSKDVLNFRQNLIDLNNAARDLIVDKALGGIPDDAERLQVEVSKATDEVRGLLDAFRESPGKTTNLNQLAVGLQKMITRLSEGGPEAQRVADRLRIILKYIQDIGAVPDINIRATLESEDVEISINKMQDEARKIGDSVTEGFASAGPEILDIWEITLAGMIPPTKKTAEQIRNEMAAALAAGRGPALIPGVAEGLPKVPPLEDKQIQARLAPFEFRISQAEVSGNRQERIRALQAERDEIQNILDTEALRLKDRTSLNNQIASIDSQIEGIQQDIAGEAKSHRDKMKELQDKAHQDLINSFNLQIAKQQNEILRAAGTKRLSDDLKQAKILRNILRGIVNSGKLTKEELISFKNALIQANQDIKKIQADIKEAQLEAAKAQQQLVIDRIELDIELAQIKEDPRAEIRNRLRLIKKLQEQLHDEAEAHGKNTLLYKQLRNKIAEERKAIQELENEAEEQNKDFQKLLFQFMQSQQGFAANLISNLIPPGVLPALGRSLGGGGGGNAGVSPGGFSIGETPEPPRLGGMLAQQAAMAESRKGGGTTAGQTAVQIDILRQMLGVLKAIQSGRAHPEARRQTHTSGSAMETL